jgi:hypothetical protein
VHLPGQHNVVFNEDEDLAMVAQRAADQPTTLTGYFVFNTANEGSREVLYTDFPRQHVWKTREKVYLHISEVQRQWVACILSMLHRASDFTCACF